MNQISQRRTLPVEPVAYDRDFVLWIEGQAALLRGKEFDLLDLPNVIEEFGDIGQRQQRDLSALIRDLTFQKLGLEVEPDFIISPQLATSTQQRDEILCILGRSPSLADRIQAYVSKTYGDALRFAERPRDRPQRTLSRERLRLEQSPSLARTITDDMERVYPRAVDAASHETGLPKNTFPPKSPYPVTQLFDYDFFP